MHRHTPQRREKLQPSRESLAHTPIRAHSSPHTSQNGVSERFVFTSTVIVIAINSS